MKNYTGDKPCPGCGKSGRESSRPAADMVCWDCRDLLKLGKATKKENETMTDYVLVYIYPFYVTSTDKSSEFFHSLVELCKSLDCPSKPAKKTVAIGYHTSSGNIRCIITQAQADAIDKLYRTVSESFKHIHEDGKKIGSNLLISLNNGDITMKDFSEHLK